MAPGPVRRRRLPVLLAAFLLAAPAAARDDGLATESVRVPVAVPANGLTETLELAGYLARPDGPGPFPIVLLTHGSPRDGSERARMRAESAGRQARDFAERGWAALSVLRRGFGTSGGSFAENAGRCGDRHYADAGRAAAADLRQAAKWLAAQPWADAGRLLVVGVSTGGFAATALAADPPPGLVGVVSFAGGRGSRGPNDVCQPDRLIDAFAQYGRTARVPALWIYAENDLYFGPELARAMDAAYRAGGAPTDFRMLPPFGDDGHRLYGRARETWWPLVDAFLNRHGLAARPQR
jgi:dienelactone hydrolase